MEEQRLIDIEIKLAHQEHLVQELNEVIAKQQKTIDEMQTGLKGFLKRFNDMYGEDGGPAKPVVEKPPHY